MKWLSDDAMIRLREEADLPDLTDSKYLALRKLGSGGMGTVYLAQDVDLGRKVAVKVMNYADSTGALASRMMREARIVALLEHPSIVPIHDVGTLDDGRVFYAMKLVQGARLDQSAAGAASLSDMLRVFQKVCEAVAFAHARGVIHRDLKPENIMVGPFGEGGDGSAGKSLRRSDAEFTADSTRAELRAIEDADLTATLRWPPSRRGTQAAARSSAPRRICRPSRRWDEPNCSISARTYMLSERSSISCLPDVRPMSSARRPTEASKQATGFRRALAKSTRRSRGR